MEEIELGTKFRLLSINYNYGSVRLMPGEIVELVEKHQDVEIQHKGQYWVSLRTKDGSIFPCHEQALRLYFTFA